MKKTLLLLVVLSVVIQSTVFLNAEKMFTLKDVINPNQIVVSGGELFVVYDASVYRYSLDSKKLINSIGKKGTGPGEFNVNHSLDMFLNVVPLNDSLLMYSSNKISTFKKSGKQLFEKKLSFFATKDKDSSNLSGICVVILVIKLLFF